MLAQHLWLNFNSPDISLGRIRMKTRNVGQSPTWWSPCRTQVVPSVQRSKVWLTLTTWLPCSNAAKTWKPLKFAGCPKLINRSQPLVGRSSPYCEGMWRTYCCLTSFFPIVDIGRHICAMVPRWRFLATFLRPVFSASRVEQVSDLHLKFALRPHHVWKYGRHPICGGWD